MESSSIYLYLRRIKVTKHILVYLAGLLVVLHTLLPHQHHSELGNLEYEIQQKEANSLLDYIKLIFQEDVGEAHLEHIVVGQGFEIDTEVNFIYPPAPSIKLFGDFLEVIPFSMHDEGNYTLLNFSPQRQHQCSLALRGPPSLS